MVGSGDPRLSSGTVSGAFTARFKNNIITRAIKHFVDNTVIVEPFYLLTVNSKNVEYFKGIEGCGARARYCRPKTNNLSAHRRPPFCCTATLYNIL